MRKILIVAALVALVGGAAVAAADGAGTVRDRIVDRRGDGSSAVRSATTLVYGAADKQRVDLYRPAAGGKGLPLVLFVHGGGWSNGTHRNVGEKPAWANRMGLWFGSVGYRYLPEAPVETQAADVGAAIRKAQAEAARYGYDPKRIILMGHSAGAHLAALVATDPRYAGEAFAAIKAVIPIDGAGYDVAAQMAFTRGPLGRIYDDAFGADPVRQRALSPTTHASKGDAPRWLIIHVADRAASARQSEMLAAALRSGGIGAAIKGIAGNHMSANRDFGKSDYPAQTEVDALIRAVIG